MKPRGRLASPSAWTGLLAVLVFALVPTVALSWFLQRALDVERLAVREELRLVEQLRLQEVAGQLVERWSRAAERRERVHRGAASRNAAWSALLAEPGVLSALLPAGDDGPDIDARRALTEPALLRARALDGSDEIPAEAWAAALQRSTSPGSRALALLGQARDLVRRGNVRRAQALLDALVADSELQGARGPVGEMLVPNAMLYALEVGGEASGLERHRRMLLACLAGGDGPAMPLAQRLFLARRLDAISGSPVRFRGRRSLELADALAPAGRFAPGSATWVDEPAGGGDSGLIVYRDAGSDLVVALDREHLASETVATARTVRGICDVVLLAPGERDPDALLAVDLAPPFRGWKVAARVPPGALRATGILWTAGLAVVVILLVGVLAAAYVSRQLRVARLGSDLVQNVSHEFRTPLAAIGALTETLERPELDDARRLEYARLIARENERLTHLVQGFLTLARLERGLELSATGVVDVAELVAEAAGILRHRFEETRQQLTIEVAEHLPLLRGDAAALTTAVRNLIDNAQRYSAHDGAVAVRVTRQPDSVRIEVEDDGIGMSPREARRCFDRYFRADERLDTRAAGCGLGLSIVRAVVHGHGGEVRVTSEPGRGSVFTIDLPLPAEGAA